MNAVRTGYILCTVAWGVMLAAVQAEAAPASWQNANSLEKAPPPKVFVVRMMEYENAMIAFGKLAIARSPTDGIREYGHNLVDDDGRAKQLAAAQAKNMNIKPSDGMSDRDTHDVSRLSGLSGNAFDTAFLKIVSRDQAAALEDFRREVGGNNGAGSKLAESQLPAIKKHMSDAVKLEKPANRPRREP